MKNESKKICSIVFQTHWDREWYLPFETFRFRLIRVMERVISALENNELDSFLFDGQVIAAEDLLDACEPEMAEKVRRFMQEGKLILGPWYVMADEYLCSGESLIRNLEIGRQLSNQLGNYQQVGYLPDTFGHIAQMPQILSGFGIHNTVLWRGIDEPCSELNWVAPDGSEIFMLFLTEGYYQHPLNTTDFIKNVDNYIEKISSKATTSELLLTQGGDHLRPSSANMAERIAQYNEQSESTLLKQSTLEEYIKTLQENVSEQTAQLVGELRGNDKAFLLPDVLSTRRYLKLLNQQAEDKLTKKVEPLLAMAPIHNYPTRYLQQNWKTLISQHAHDSICGCSVDEVHREMVTRYEKLDQRNDALITMAQSALGCTSDEMHTEGADPFADFEQFTLFNPQPKSFEGWITEKIFLSGDEVQGITLTDADNNATEVVMISTTEGFQFTSPIDDFPDKVFGFWYEISFFCLIEGLGHNNYKVTKQLTTLPFTTQSGRCINNDFYEIEVCHDATLTITDKSTGKVFSQQGRIESSLDCGDSYTFSAPKNDQLSVAYLDGTVQVCQHEQYSELCYPVALTQPQRLSHDRRGASDAMVVSKGTVKIKLHHNSPEIKCDISWDNQAEDHRLSLHFPTNEKLGCTYADSAFEVVSRPVVYQDNQVVLPNKEANVSVNGTQSFVVAGDIQVNHIGVTEYRIVDNKSDELAMTLLRCVGWLSRRDFSTRGNGAGPDLPTPEAQCLGVSHYQLSIQLGQYEPATACNTAAKFRTSPFVIQGQSDLWKTAISTANEALQCSSVRQIGDYLELRLWNPTEESQPVALSKAYEVVDFVGESQPYSDHIEPFKIMTLRIQHIA